MVLLIVRNPYSMTKKNQYGFTLVELLVFIAILSVFFVTAVTVAVASLRNIKTNEQRIMATRYAEEVAEWVRSEREADWPAFILHGSDFGQFFCFNQTPIQAWPTDPNPANCTFNSLQPALFRRSMVLTTYGNNNQAKATINVSWNIGTGSTLNVPLTVDFAVWEQRP